MYVISFIGQYAGYLIAYFSQDELEEGKKYFQVIEIICLLLLLYFNFIFSWLIILGLVISLFIVKKEYFYLGVFTGFVNYLIIFIYGLAYGTLNYDNMKRLLLNILFTLPLYLLSFKFNLLYLAYGGLIGILIHKFKNFNLPKL